jgi:hypothetical protein
MKKELLKALNQTLKQYIDKTHNGWCTECPMCLAFRMDGTWGVIREGKTRQVRFPVSKKRLEEFQIPKDLIINLMF